MLNGDGGDPTVITSSMNVLRTVLQTSRKMANRTRELLLLYNKLKFSDNHNMLTLTSCGGEEDALCSHLLHVKYLAMSVASHVDSFVFL